MSGFIFQDTYVPSMTKLWILFMLESPEYCSHHCCQIHSKGSGHDHWFINSDSSSEISDKPVMKTNVVKYSEVNCIYGKSNHLEHNNRDIQSLYRIAIRLTRCILQILNSVYRRKKKIVLSRPSSIEYILLASCVKETIRSAPLNIVVSKTIQLISDDTM